MSEQDIIRIIAGAVAAGFGTVAILKARAQAIAITVAEAAAAGIAAVIAVVTGA